MPVSTISSSTSNGDPPSSAATPASSNFTSPNPTSYEAAESIEEIMILQLREDIKAYKIDLDICHSQNGAPDITPQEMRSLQLRVLDLNHSIRQSQHRVQLLEWDLKHSSSTSGLAQTIGSYPRTNAPALKRSAAAPVHSATKRLKMDGSPDLDIYAPSFALVPGQRNPVTQTQTTQNQVRQAVTTSANFAHFSADEDDEEQRTLLHGNNTVQRLGFWKCRLCSSQKYLMAAGSRQPAAPCKWPLKDIAKIIAHFTDLHTEHDPQERCAELGAALDRNRGPFQYWLTRSHSQNLGDGRIIDDCIENLYAGQLPPTLRKLSRAAAAFPGQPA